MIKNSIAEYLRRRFSFSERFRVIAGSIEPYVPTTPRFPRPSRVPLELEMIQVLSLHGKAKSV